MVEHQYNESWHNLKCDSSHTSARKYQPTYSYQGSFRRCVLSNEEDNNNENEKNTNSVDDALRRSILFNTHRTEHMLLSLQKLTKHHKTHTRRSARYQITIHGALWYLLAEHVLAQGGWSAHLTLQNLALLSDMCDSHPQSAHPTTHKPLPPLSHNSYKQTAPIVSS